ncbi:mutator type transposase [Tanacetum coccineum]
MERSNKYAARVSEMKSLVWPIIIRNLTPELENGLVELVVDKDVYEMLMYVDKFKVIELYTDHTVKKQHVLTQEPLATIIDVTQPGSSSGNEAEVDVSEDEWLRESLKKLPIKSKKGQQSSRKEVGQSSRNGSGSENGSGSDSGSDSEDSDYFVDEENLIEDVDVDMADLRDTQIPGNCEMEVTDEGVRRKALRKVDRMNKAIHVSKLPNEDTWEVRTLKDTHTCLQSRIVSKCTTTFLSKDVEETIKPNDKITLNTLKDQLQKKFEVGVSKQKVFRAKKMAYERVVGSYSQQYAQLRDYCMELKEKNPNTTLRKRTFKMMVSKLEKRKIFLVLDGCFLSGPYPGQILTAVGVDPNNGIYPLAYAVVESESKDSWKWFLDCLGDDLELFRNSNFTFISDRQKGVIPAIAENFPNAEHRFCLKHIYDNMKLSWRGKFYKEMLWKCATASTIQKFDKRMEEMKNHNLEAYEWLRKIPPQHWARQLLDGRDKPIITCLEYIGIPYEENCECSEGARQVEWNGSDLYQVTCPWGDQFVVNLSERVCSCRKWELSGIPCTHAVASIWDQANNGIDTGIPDFL